MKSKLPGNFTNTNCRLRTRGANTNLLVKYTLLLEKITWFRSQTRGNENYHLQSSDRLPLDPYASPPPKKRRPANFQPPGCNIIRPRYKNLPDSGSLSRSRHAGYKTCPSFTNLSEIGHFPLKGGPWSTSLLSDAHTLPLAHVIDGH